jgi:hypothetical protein
MPLAALKNTRIVSSMVPWHTGQYGVPSSSSRRARASHIPTPSTAIPRTRCCAMHQQSIKQATVVISAREPWNGLPRSACA